MVKLTINTLHRERYRLQLFSRDFRNPEEDLKKYLKTLEKPENLEKNLKTLKKLENLEKKPENP